MTVVSFDILIPTASKNAIGETERVRDGPVVIICGLELVVLVFLGLLSAEIITICVFYFRLSSMAWRAIISRRKSETYA